MYIYMYAHFVAVLKVLRDHYDQLLDALPICPMDKNFKMFELLQLRCVAITDCVFHTFPQSKQEIFDFLIISSYNDWQLLGLCTIMESLIQQQDPGKLVVIEIFRNGKLLYLCTVTYVCTCVYYIAIAFDRSYTF